MDDKWQPIETAPKEYDGRLLTDGTIVTYGGWLSDTDQGAEWEGQIGCAGWWTIDCKDGFRPTHWQPLPPPPADGAPVAATPASTTGSAVVPAAWMDPETRDVITHERKQEWLNHFGDGGKKKAAGYTLPLVFASGGSAVVPAGEEQAHKSNDGVGADQWCHECMVNVKQPCSYKDCPVGPALGEGGKQHG